MRSAVVAIALTGLLLLSAAGTAAAAPAPTFWEPWSAAERAAIKEYFAGLTRGNDGGTYHPSDLSPKPDYSRKAGAAMVDYAERVTYLAPGADRFHTGTVQAAQKTGLWARVGETALGVARSRGGQVALRAAGPGGAVVAGLWYLWENGCSVGSLFCRKVQIQATAKDPVAGKNVRYSWTGATGECGNGITAAAAPASGDCAQVSGSTLQRTWTGPNVDWPANVLRVEWETSPGTWRSQRQCDASVASMAFIYNAYAASLDDADNGICTETYPPDPEQYGVSEGVGTNADKTGPVICKSGCNAGTGDDSGFYDRTYGYRRRGHWLDPGLGRVLEPPRGTDPTSWSAVPSNDTARLKSEAPSPPSDANLEAKLEEFLEADTPESEIHRETISFGLGTLADEDDPSWTAEPTPVIPDDGPVYGTFSMPNCVGATVEACQSALTAAGHTGDVSLVVLTPLQADLEKPAGAIVTTSPGPDANVTASTTVTLTRNPDTLPLVVPFATPGETAADYLARLQALGLVGNIVTLSDSNYDPEFGPDEVVRTNPVQGSRADPGTNVTVVANPTTAPAAVGAVSADCGLTPPSATLNLSPITSVQLGDKVPFSLVAWVAATTAGVATAAERPNVTFTVLGVSADLSWLANFDGLVGILRSMLAVLLWLGVAWFLYGRTIGKGT